MIVGDHFEFPWCRAPGPAPGRRGCRQLSAHRAVDGPLQIVAVESGRADSRGRGESATSGP
jgi:hypothetical protein